MTSKIEPTEYGVTVIIHSEQGEQSFHYDRHSLCCLRETTVCGAIGFVPTLQQVRDAQNAAWNALENEAFIVLPKLI